MKRALEPAMNPAMNPAEIERLLAAQNAAEQDIEPSSNFTHAVLAALARERHLAELRPLSFPWLTTGLGAATGLVAAWLFLRQPAVVAWQQRVLAELAQAQLAPLEFALFSSALALLLLVLGLSFWLVRRAS